MSPQAQAVSAHPSRRLGLAAVLAAALTLTPIPAPGAPGWDGRGRVVAVDPVAGTVTLDHEAIGGLLPARRSTFTLEQVDLVRVMAPGDRVHFSLLAADESHGLLSLGAVVVERPITSSWPTILLGAAATLSALGLAAAVGLGVLLWRSLQRLHQRVTALDHELGMLQRLGGETSDASRQIVRALHDIAHTVLGGLIRDLRARVAQATGRTAGAPAPLLMVVQRGRTDVFRAAEARDEGGFEVIWDRRRGDRRLGQRAIGRERRQGERRAAPPETWGRLGFALVPGEPGEAGRDPEPRPARPLRAVGGERGGPR